MKKHLALLGAAAALLSMLFAGCSGINDLDATVTDSDIKEGHVVTINLSNYSEILKSCNVSKSSSRSIISESYNLEDSLSFYLFADSVDHSVKDAISLSSISVSESNKKTGTIQVTLPSNVYDLTIVAYDFGDLAAADKPEVNYAYLSTLDYAVLRGSSKVDMTKHSNTATFTLSSTGLTKAGHLNMTIELLDKWFPSTDYKITAGVYELELKNTAVKYSEGTSTVETLYDYSNGIVEKFSGNTSGNLKASFGASEKDIAPGSYSFVVTFYNTKTQTSWEYSDALTVLPGKTVTENVQIINMIEATPEVPASLKASYVANSEDTLDGYYDVKFDWTDSSKNETNFVLEIAELDSNALVEDTTENSNAFTTLMTTKSNSVAFDDFYNSAANSSITYQDCTGWICSAGSLYKNNTSVTVKLPLGVRFAARITAKNNAGYSKKDSVTAYTYATLATAEDSEITSEKFDGTTINRYRVTYDFNGGTAGTAASKTVYSSSDAYKVAYATEDDPNPTLTESSNTYAFNAWYETASQAAPETYTDGANHSVFATYGSGSTIIINDPNDYKIDLSKITVKYGDSDITISESTTNEETNETTTSLKISKLETADNTNLVVTYTTTYKYSSMLLESFYSGSKYLTCSPVVTNSNGTYTYTFTVENYKPAAHIYEFELTAKMNTVTYGNPFYIEVVE